MRKTIIIVLTVISLLLSSCAANVIDIPERTRMPADTEEIEFIHSVITAPEVVKPELPDIGDPAYELSLLFDEDYEGTVFLIAYDKEDHSPAVVHENGLYTSASERLQLISKKYNISIADYKMERSEMFSETKANVKSDDYTADLMLLPIELYSQFVKEGLLVDFNDSAFYDKDAYYFSHSFSDMLLYKGTVCGAWTDALKAPEDMVVLYVNLDLLGENAPDIEKDALGGKLTWEYLENLTEVVSIPCSSSIDYIKNASLGSDVSEELSEYLKAAEEKIKEDEEDEEDGDEQEEPSKSAVEIFLSGESVFYFGSLEDSKLFGKTEFRWSLLPVPKESEDGRYRRVYDCSKGITVACIPKNCFSIDRSMQVIIALTVSTVKSNEADALDAYYDFMRSNNARLLLNYLLFETK